MSAPEYLNPTMRSIGPINNAEETADNFAVSLSIVDASTRFNSHLHSQDQLAWMAVGALDLTVDSDEWHLRREHIAWIPAGMLHEMTFDQPGELISIYSDTVLRPLGDQWVQAHIVAADDLVQALLRSLAVTGSAPRRRIRCRELLHDILGEANVNRGGLVLPREQRAKSIASNLIDNPADDRDLAHWAVAAGVSAKTISRAFLADTGFSFREWRILARLHSAAGLLEQGHSVQNVASEVGYLTSSSFIAAFKSRFGVTPARYPRPQATP